MIGTFILVFIHSGIVLQYNKNPEDINPIGVALVQGGTNLALSYALGQVSGGHFNPLVTLAFVLRRDLQAKLIPFYWIPQFIGGLLGALLLMAFFGNTGNLGASMVKPGVNLAQAVFFESFLTFGSLVVILGTASRGHVVGPQSAIAVGATEMCMVYFGRTLGVGSMNPARSFGPGILTGGVAREQLWIFFAGPFMGMLLATGFMILITKKHTEEVKERVLGHGSVDVDDNEAGRAVV